MLLFGRLADLYGRKLTFILGGIWLGAFALGCSFATGRSASFLSEFHADRTRSDYNVRFAWVAGYGWCCDDSSCCLSISSCEIPSSDLCFPFRLEFLLLRSLLPKHVPLRLLHLEPVHLSVRISAFFSPFGTFLTFHVGSVFGSTIGALVVELTACVSFTFISSDTDIDGRVIRQTWRSVFYMSTGIAVLVCIGGYLTIDPDQRSPEQDRRVDWFGSFLITAALTLIIFVLSEGSIAPHGWGTSCKLDVL